MLQLALPYQLLFYHSLADSALEQQALSNNLEVLCYVGALSMIKPIEIAFKLPLQVVILIHSVGNCNQILRMPAGLKQVTLELLVVLLLLPKETHLAFHLVDVVLLLQRFKRLLIFQLDHEFNELAHIEAHALKQCEEQLVNPCMGAFLQLSQVLELLQHLFVLQVSFLEEVKELVDQRFLALQLQYGI